MKLYSTTTFEGISALNQSSNSRSNLFTVWNDKTCDDDFLVVLVFLKINALLSVLRNKIPGSLIIDMSSLYFNKKLNGH